MGVVYGSPDVFPYVCAKYVCACGRTASRHGRDAGKLPTGWIRLRGEGKADHVCAECAPELSAGSEGSARGPDSPVAT